MKKDVWKIILSLIIVLLVFGLILFLDTKSTIKGECSIDSDCVPASCCHPTQCVAEINKPDCSSVSCTSECAPNTLDCGGECICNNGRCKAQLP